jgi:predicted amidophosphoribosyltransferase
MPVWCPQCHAMLPEGLGKCPRCGARLGQAASEENEVFSKKDMFWYSAYTIGMMLIPFVFILIIGLLCVWLFNR